MATSALAAKHIFISTSRFRDLVSNGTIKHQPNGKYNIDKVREQYIKNAQLVMAGRGGGESGVVLAKERALLARSQRRAVDLKNRAAFGTHVECDALKSVLEVEFLNIRDKNLALGGKLADRLSGRIFTRAEVAAVISAEVRELLNDLAEVDVYVDRVAGKQVPDDGNEDSDNSEV
jgi:hypothetical protein